MNRHDERGVTLIELLIAITITTIIMGPIAGAIFVGLRTSGATQNRVQESAGSNLLSSYVGPDVQNAVAVQTNVSEAAGACPAPLMTVPLLITMPATAGQLSSISYYPGTSAATQNTLYRRVCLGGHQIGNPTVISRLLANPALLTPPGSSPLVASCVPVGCGTGFQTVTVNMAQLNQAFDAAPYVASVTAARRLP